MIVRHAEYTGSKKAQRILDDWEKNVTKFVRVMPRDYQRMLDALERARSQGLTGDDAVMGAFELNKADESRVGGN